MGGSSAAMAAAHRAAPPARSERNGAPEASVVNRARVGIEGSTATSAPPVQLSAELARSQYALPRGGELLEACTAAQNHRHVGAGLSYGQERRSLGEPHLSGRP